MRISLFSQSLFALPLEQAIRATAEAGFGAIMYNTHLKNGYVDAEGAWHFQALDQGWTDYVLVLGMLRDANYGGYLTLECLSPEARDRPAQTAQSDLRILQGYLSQVGWNPE